MLGASVEVPTASLSGVMGITGALTRVATAIGRRGSATVTHGQIASAARMATSISGSQGRGSPALISTSPTRTTTVSSAVMPRIGPAVASAGGIGRRSHSRDSRETASVAVAMTDSYHLRTGSLAPLSLLSVELLVTSLTSLPARPPRRYPYPWHRVNGALVVEGTERLSVYDFTVDVGGLVTESRD